MKFCSFILLLFLSLSFFAQGTWVQKKDYANGSNYVDEGIAFSIGTKGYVGLGQGNPFNKLTTEFWEWNQATNTWTQKANFAGSARMSAIAFAVNGKGYVGTGIDATQCYDDMWEYNPATNIWTQKANFGWGQVYDAVGFAIGNNGYVATGHNLSGSYMPDLWQYNPASNTWTDKGVFAGGGREQAIAFVIGTKAYIGLGVFLKDLWEWNSGTNTWTKKADFPYLKYNAAAFSIGTTGYVGTGDSSIGYWTKDFYGWDQAANTWTRLADYGGKPRESAIGFSIGCKGYMGISDEPADYSEFYEYTPDQPKLAQAGPDQSICSGGNVQLTAVTGAGYRYSWTPATGLNNDTIYNPVASPTVTTQYILTVTTPQGCTGKDTVNVIVGKINVTATPKLSYFCLGTDDSLHALATAAATYAWSPATGLSCINCANPVASPATNTTYIVTATSTSGGCTSTDTVNVVPAGIKVSAGLTACSGDSNVISATGGTNYSWSPASSLINPLTATPTAHPLSTTQYTVTVTTGSCMFIDSVLVTVNNNLSVDAGRDTTICPGKNVTLSASGGKKYSWTPTAGLSSPNIFNPVATPTATTNYIVNVSSGGCTGKDSVLVAVDSLPKPAAGNDTSICKGAVVNLSASGGATYLWSPGAGLTCASCAVTTATPLNTTKYIVTVTSVSGCSGKDSVTVTVNNKPVIDAGATATVKLGASIQLNGSGGGNYFWLPGAELTGDSSATPITTPSNTTTYTLVVTDVNGCLATDTVTVFVIKPSCIGSDEDLFVANIFSPNGDGKNDVLQLKGNGITNVYWAIYDRWGNLIFETSDQSQGWDGTKKGSAMGTGTYVYYIKATCIKTNSELRLKGNVTLVK